MNLTILGYHSAIPTIFSHPSSQYLVISNIGLLIDCGEGTQIQLQKAKINIYLIKQIFISHLHGDHLFGLIGLLSSFSLLGRTNPIYIFGPRGIKKFINIQLKIINFNYIFSIIFNELDSNKSELIFESSIYSVRTIPLSHRIYTNGYLFKEKNNNIVVPNFNKKIFTIRHTKSYAYCSDTSYNESIISIIENSTVLYHESTFLEELKIIAKKTGHSTALEAGKIAFKANVKKLILGHFSNRYSDYNLFLIEAKSIFKNTFLPNLLENIII